MCGEHAVQRRAALRLHPQRRVDHRHAGGARIVERGRDVGQPPLALVVQRAQREDASARCHPADRSLSDEDAGHERAVALAVGRQVVAVDEIPSPGVVHVPVVIVVDPVHGIVGVAGDAVGDMRIAERDPGVDDRHLDACSGADRPTRRRCDPVGAVELRQEVLLIHGVDACIELDRPDGVVPAEAPERPVRVPRGNREHLGARQRERVHEAGVDALAHGARLRRRQPGLAGHDDPVRHGGGLCARRQQTRGERARHPSPPHGGARREWRARHVHRRSAVRGHRLTGIGIVRLDIKGPSHR